MGKLQGDKSFANDRKDFLTISSRGCLVKEQVSYHSAPAKMGQGEFGVMYGCWEA